MDDKNISINTENTKNKIKLKKNTIETHITSTILPVLCYIAISQTIKELYFLPITSKILTVACSVI